MPQTKKKKYCKICNVELPYGKSGKTCSDSHRVELIKRTKLEKYGSSAYNNRAKAKETLQTMYGVDNVAQLDDVKNKVTDKGRWFSRIDVSGKNNPHYGYTHSEETKKLQRLRRVDSLLNKQNHYPGYNPSSIPIIEAKADELGITDLQHAENGGEYHIEELGYFVDGYSKEKNIVIEYDEPHHLSELQSKKDKKRQHEITEYLKCEFIRISEK